MHEALVVILSGFAWVLMLIGCVFVVAGGVGLIRLPDLYTRLHAAGVMDTGATIFMMLSMTLIAIAQYQNPWIAGKLILILFFTLFTTPTSSHALAKTALLSGLVPKDENGKPIIASAELASKIALSREPIDGVIGVAASVDDNNARLVQNSSPDDGPDNNSDNGNRSK